MSDIAIVHDAYTSDGGAERVRVGRRDPSLASTSGGSGGVGERLADLGYLDRTDDAPRAETQTAAEMISNND